MGLEKRVNKFYLLLWFKWSLRLTVESTLLAGFFSLIVTLFLYVKQGASVLNESVVYALVDIFFFWFAILWSVALLLALFRGIKYIFHGCNNAYKLDLYSCEKEQGSELIVDIGYGDLVKVWRKWFMLMIWLVASQMIIAYILSTEWFSIVMLYLYIQVAGFFSFMILSAKCKRIKIVRC